MLTRGYIIGKIIDDLAKLQGQIEMRNKVGLFDLTKISEDFFREILNIICDLNLVNLNQQRSNEPGIDLGDSKKKIAFQITSERTSKKIIQTLEKLSPKQLEKYNRIVILIIGRKQSSYTIKPNLLESSNFDVDRDIIDIDDISKQIVVQDYSKLNSLDLLFQNSFQNVIIDIEPMDKEGNFESSIYKYIESIPNSPPKNTKKYTSFYSPGETHDMLSGFVKLYKKLALIPKNQREYVSIIAERGKLFTNRTPTIHCAIHCTKLAAILGTTEKSLFRALSYLEDEEMIFLSDDYHSYNRPNYKYIIKEEYLIYLIEFLKENNLSIRKTIVALDFSVLEE